MKPYWFFAYVVVSSLLMLLVVFGGFKCPGCELQPVDNCEGKLAVSNYLLAESIDCLNGYVGGNGYSQEKECGEFVRALNKNAFVDAWLVEIRHYEGKLE